MTLENFVLPAPPTFTETQLEEAKRTNNFHPLLFEIYKHIGLMAAKCVQIRFDSPDIKGINSRHYAILIGLLNRACRIMLANVALTHEGRFGETMRLLNRCIVESAINIMWLCKRDDPSLFDRYLADGTRHEVELHDLICQNISQRGGKVLRIEERMLSSVRKYIESTGLSEESIRKSRRLPSFKDKLKALDLGDTVYLAMQRIGSHAIHGTWPDLLRFYLDRSEEDTFAAADHNSTPHPYDYVYVGLFVLIGMRSFLNYISGSKWDLDKWFPQIRETYELLLKVDDLRAEGDFEGL